MNIFQIRAAWATRRLGVSLAELVVALAIADHADKAGRAWPGRQTLAEQTGLDARTVARAIARLRALGVLVVVSEGRGRGRKTVFSLSVAPPEKGAHVTPFEAGKGGADAPFSETKKGAFTPVKGGIHDTYNHKGTIHARARTRGDLDEGRFERWAERLADGARRRGAGCLVLSEWRAPEVVRLAVERFGADPETLHRAGLDVPPDLRGRAHG